MPGPDYIERITALCEAQNWHCCYCGIVVTVGIHSPVSATIDHVVPKTAGGSDLWENLAAACKLCNNARSAMDYRKYVRLVKWKGREKAAKYAHRLRHKLHVRTFRAKIAAGTWEKRPRLDGYSG